MSIALGKRPNALLRRATAAWVVPSVLAVTLALPAMAQAPSPGTSGSTVRVGLVEGGIIRLEGDYISEPAIFSRARLGRCCLARTLLAYPGLPLLEGGTVLHPDLAADDPTISPDGLHWTFEIRPGIRYQPPFDDRTVVAADIIRAIERSVRISPELVDPSGPFESLEGAAAFARGEAPVISGLRSPDPMMLTFTLTSPDGAFGHSLSDLSTAPIPEGAADGHDPVFPEMDPSAAGPPPDPETPFGPRFVSTGPFMFEGYPATVTDGRANLVRNPSWDPETDPLRRPVAERIEILTLPTGDAAIEMLERGEVDIVDHPAQPATLARYRSDPELAGRLIGATTETLAYVPMNLAVPPFDDVAVRRAVNAVIDRAALRDALLDARAELPWLSGVRSSADVAHHVFADHLTAGLLATYRPFPSPGGRGDVEAARAEMRDSRYDSDKDGLCDADICSGVVLVADFPTAGAVVQEGLAAIGIEAQVVPMSDDVDMSLPANHTPIQVNWYQWGYGLNGDLGELLRGGPTLDVEGGTVNQSLVGATPEQLAAWGYEVTDVPSVDRLIDACEREMGHRRAACWARLDQVLSEVIVPWIPVYSLVGEWLVSPRVVSAKADQTAFVTFPALDRMVVQDAP